MNARPAFRTFFCLLLAVFLFTWFGLVVLPWIELGHLPPIQDEGKHRHHAVGRLRRGPCGRARLRRQRLRLLPHPAGPRPPLPAPTSSAAGARPRDEDDKDESPAAPIRAITSGSGQVFLGNSREGADLTNVAPAFLRRRRALPLSLRSLRPDPAPQQHARVPFPFRRRARSAARPRRRRWSCPMPTRRPPVMKSCPRPQAKALVAYLLSLKKDYHLPDESGPRAAAGPGRANHEHAKSRAPFAAVAHRTMARSSPTRPISSRRPIFPSRRYATRTAARLALSRLRLRPFPGGQLLHRLRRIRPGFRPGPRRTRSSPPAPAQPPPRRSIRWPSASRSTAAIARTVTRPAARASPAPIRPWPARNGSWATRRRSLPSCCTVSRARSPSRAAAYGTQHMPGWGTTSDR